MGVRFGRDENAAAVAHRVFYGSEAAIVLPDVAAWRRHLALSTEMEIAAAAGHCRRSGGADIDRRGPRHASASPFIPIGNTMAICIHNRQQVWRVPLAAAALN